MGNILKVIKDIKQVPQNNSKEFKQLAIKLLLVFWRTVLLIYLIKLLLETSDFYFCIFYFNFILLKNKNFIALNKIKPGRYTLYSQKFSKIKNSKWMGEALLRVYVCPLMFSLEIRLKFIFKNFIMSFHNNFNNFDKKKIIFQIYIYNIN